MSNLFVTILNMSINTCYVIIAVIIVRLLLKKAPKIFSYVLWLAVLFRLVCPISFESSLGVLPANTNTIPVGINYIHEPNLNSEINMTSDVVIPTINNTLPDIVKEKNIILTEILVQIGLYFWIIGMVILLGYSYYSYIKLKRSLYYATLVKDNIFESEQIKTPFVMGIIKPKIYIPIGINIDEFDYIIKHEQVHIKRKDNLIKILAFFTLLLHWFNPLVWLSFILMVKDMEMSCDESVMKQSKEDIRERYSTSLLSFSISQSGLISPLSFGESNVKERIKNVLQYKKPGFWISFILVILVISLIIGFTLNQKTKDNEPSDLSKDLTEPQIETTMTDTQSEGETEDYESNNTSKSVEDDIVAKEPDAVLPEGSDTILPEESVRVDYLDDDLKETEADYSDIAVLGDQVNSVFAGTFGNKDILMAIYRDGSQLTASYITRDDDTEVVLQGSIDGNNITLNLYNGDKIVGIFKGKEEADDGINGTFESLIDGTQLPLLMRLDRFIGNDIQTRYLGYETNEVETFVKNIKEYIKEDNKKGFSNLINYPINVTTTEGKIIINDAAEFEEKYDEIIHYDFKNVISNAYTKYMFSNYQGIMMEQGLIWISAVYGKEGLWIIGINN